MMDYPPFVYNSFLVDSLRLNSYKFGSITTLDYAIFMKAAVVPAFLLGIFSTRKIGYLLIAPTVSCLCILLPPWIDLHNTKLGGGGDAFFWVLIVTPGYYLLYIGASMLGYFLKSLMRKNILA